MTGHFCHTAERKLRWFRRQRGMVGVATSVRFAGRVGFAGLFGILIAAQSSASDVFLDETPVGRVAHYTMTNSLGFQSQAKNIQLWMSATDRVLLYPQQHIAEHWTRDKREQTEFTRHFLSAERSIFYPQGALRSLQLPMDWQGGGQLISPKITEQLSEVDCDKTAVLAANVVSSEKVTCYRGKLGDQTIKLAWLDEENIPAYLNIVGKMKRYEYTLTGYEPWQATHTDTVMRWKRFLTTDYADVADDAVDDPFLARAVAAGYVYAAGAHRH